MKTILRISFFAMGCALTAAPMILLLSFSYGVGEPPSSDPKGFRYFVAPLLVGLVLGGGLLLVGLPNLVVGHQRPALRIAAAISLAISAVAVTFTGFSGAVTAFVGPVLLSAYALAFYYFVYPAKRFRLH